MMKSRRYSKAVSIAETTITSCLAFDLQFSRLMTNAPSKAGRCL
jgi:hypothetical protein